MDSERESPLPQQECEGCGCVYLVAPNLVAVTETTTDRVATSTCDGCWMVNWRFVGEGMADRLSGVLREMGTGW